MQLIASYRLTGSSKLALHLHPEHLADLRGSGLSDGTIRAADVYSLAPMLISHFLEERREVPFTCAKVKRKPWPRIRPDSMPWTSAGYGTG